MIIDCDECAMQHTVVCDECVVTFILEESASVELNDGEASAISNLADVGLVPRLRLVPRTERARRRSLGG